MHISQKYPQIFTDLIPFIYSYPGNLDEFNLSPFEVQRLAHFSPFKSEDLYFFNLLKKLDSNSFADSGMGMDNWVFLDCAIMPSAVVGYSIKAKNAPKELLIKYSIPVTYEGLIPLSMFIAIPMAKSNTWFAHNLCSSNSFLDTKFNGLGLVTKKLGLEIFKIKNLMGATQWNNSSLHVHTKIAKLRVETVHTPVHSHPESLIYSCTIKGTSLIETTKESLGHFKFYFKDTKSLQDLKIKILNEPVFIVSGPMRDDSGEFVYLSNI